MKFAHKIAIAQINPTVGDLTGNGKKIIEYIEKAKVLGANIVIFPEQAVTGYPCQDLLLHDDFVKDVNYVNDQIAKNTEGITAIIGSIKKKENKLYNVAIVIKDGKIFAEQAKTALPTYDVFYEARYFTPSSSISPIEIDGVKYGIQICEDMWDKSKNITKRLVDLGAEAIINISASPYYVHKKQVRYEIIKNHAQENNVPFIYVNTIGGQDELIFDGASMAVDSTGTLVSQLLQFEEDLQIIDFNAKKELEVIVKEEEIFKALRLGVKDYLRKNNIRKAVLGLSGGIDSAVTATIAAEALGAENVKGFALPSQFNKSDSIEDARTLARNLGINFDIIPIRGMYDKVLEEVRKTFDEKPFDETEENIQARLRMLILMSQANKHKYLLLSTGDKSEAALGYCTLYGDMSGGLAVISDLTKPEVYDLAKWYNAMKGKEIIPQHTLTKKPSPELKPGQVAPFNYTRISPLLEQMANRLPVKKLLETYTIDELRETFIKYRAAEFKRWQSPVALKCKECSFGKGRMYPVTNKYIPFDLMD